MPMFCPECGTRLDNDMLFCPECGTRIEQESAKDFEIPVLIKEMPKGDSTSTVIYPLILGGVFALAGTPCSTPILAAIMAFASLSASLVQAVIMLFLFSLGQGLILVLAGVLTSKLKTWKNFYKLSDILLKVSGVLLILTSLYIFYKIFAPLIVK